MSSPPQGLSFEELLANLSLGDTPRTSQSAPPPRYRERETPISLTPTQPHPVPRRHGQISVTTIIDWAPAPAVHLQADAPVPGLTPRPNPVRHSYASDSTTERPTIYRYQTPTQSSLTTSWATAGTATQGVPDASVAVVQKGTPKKKGPKNAYVVFHGRDPGVYAVWLEVKAKVNGFSNAIYRGYGSREEAEAAFAYALDHHWVRGAGADATPIIFTPPTPLQSVLDVDPVNPLQGSERLDWQVVFRGIVPGVYSSVIEAMLNTSGVPNALYKAYNTKQAAFAAWDLACQRGEVKASPPPSYYHIV